MAELDWVVGMISDLRSLRSELNVPAAAQIPAVLVGLDDERRARLGRWGDLVKRLGRLSAIDFATGVQPGSVQMPIPGGVLVLTVADVIDVVAETKRLEKERGRIENDAAKLGAKLENPGFLAKASADIIDETRDRLSELLTRRDQLAGAMAQLASSAAR